jgi:hypothetical protein
VAKGGTEGKTMTKLEQQEEIKQIAYKVAKKRFAPDCPPDIHIHDMASYELRQVTDAMDLIEEGIRAYIVTKQLTQEENGQIESIFGPQDEEPGNE